jgi:hypothetical protein
MSPNRSNLCEEMFQHPVGSQRGWLLRRVEVDPIQTFAC